jgi:hypothetical protein
MQRHHERLVETQRRLAVAALEPHVLQAAEAGAGEIGVLPVEAKDLDRIPFVEWKIADGDGHGRERG